MFEKEMLWLDIDAFSKISEQSKLPFTIAIAFDLVMFIWWPTKQPFSPDAKAIVSRLDDQFGEAKYKLSVFEEHLEEVRRFFTVLPDGRWTPSLEIFTVNNPTPEHFDRDGGLS